MSLKSAVLEQLRVHAKKRPKDPVFMTLSGKKYYADDLIKEIEEETTFGLDILDKIVKTATDAFLRQANSG